MHLRAVRDVMASLNEELTARHLRPNRFIRLDGPPPVNVERHAPLFATLP